ncbi:3-keto-disaccharide hydrolase [Pelagicoccus mobilis]|uniref:DUF1080 domain-containing protein n=1 Tax=Pelagicoccus mobilis TaxID=415221 RepID=A0A934RX47_9BACT|nr:DUF1080 domain-containing protein [Pelagicoccus mobilis]MBK1875997.1 DUF1080 domain-containing protein [Pelagicoccus mobilis]
MKYKLPKILVSLSFAALAATLSAKPAPTPTWTDASTAAKEHPGFDYLGEYKKGKTALQVVPAEGRFYLSIYRGGLPGAGWDGGRIKHEWVELDAIKARLKGFKKVDRSSRLDFPKAPKGAITLFDGTSVEEWGNGKIKNGLLQAGTKSRRQFKDFKLHLEFMVPYKPELPLSHPDRGNSGVFALGAYEVQVADTFGLDESPEAWKDIKQIKKPNTWCGSVYGLNTQNVNMCLPPLSWQSLDIEFTAARFEGEKKISSARISVWQNGVLIHDDFVLPSGTGGGPRGPRPEVAQGPILIQNHHNPTQYRNIWVIEK